MAPLFNRLALQLAARTYTLSNESTAACNLLEVYSAAFNASSRVARERCTRPDLLRGAWNVSFGGAPGVLTLPGMVGADAALVGALGPNVSALLAVPRNHWAYDLGVSRVLLMAITVRCGQRMVHVSRSSLRQARLGYQQNVLLKKQGWLYNAFWTNSSVRLPCEGQDGSVQGMYMPLGTVVLRVYADAETQRQTRNLWLVRL